MNKTTALQMLVERLEDWPTKIKQLTSSLPGWVWRVDANDNIVLVVSHIQAVDIAYPENMITEDEWFEAVPSCGPPGDIPSTREAAMTTLRIEIVDWPDQIHTALPMPTGWIWVHLLSFDRLPMLVLTSESDRGIAGVDPKLTITIENFNEARRLAIEELKNVEELDPVQPSETPAAVPRDVALNLVVNCISKWPESEAQPLPMCDGWKWVNNSMYGIVFERQGMTTEMITQEHWLAMLPLKTLGALELDPSEGKATLSKGYEVDEVMAPIELKVLPDIVDGKARLRRDEAVEYCNENYYKWPMSKLDVLSNAPPHGWEWVTIGDEQALKSIKGYAYIIRDSLDKFAQEHCDILDDGMEQLASDLTGTLRPKQERYLDSGGDDWIDEYARIATPEEFRGAMMFTIGKYQRRLGKKDSIKNEVEKIADYGNRWAQYENQQTPEF